MPQLQSTSNERGATCPSATLRSEADDDLVAVLLELGLQPDELRRPFEVGDEAVESGIVCTERLGLVAGEPARHECQALDPAVLDRGTHDGRLLGVELAGPV